MKYKNKGRKREIRMATLILQLGISMLTCIFLCVFAGLFLAGKLGQPFWFPLFLVLGILSGFRSCYYLILRSGGFEPGEGGQYDDILQDDQDEGDQDERDIFP